MTFDLPQLYSGKVRELYDAGDDRLLMVASNRVSAFDVIMTEAIAHKGRVLTQISLFWFEFLGGLVPNHLVTADVDRYPAAVGKYADQLQGRSMMGASRGSWPLRRRCCLIADVGDTARRRRMKRPG